MRRPPEEPEQRDLFICDLQDVSIKDSRETMVFPFLSLSKRPRFEPIQYEAVRKDGQGNQRTDRVTVTGSKPFGIATIWDFDLMLWMFSQLAAISNSGEKPPQRFGFHAFDCMRAIQRTDHKGRVGGSDYKAFEAALRRLRTTVIHTNITGGSNSESVGWLEDLTIQRDGKDRVQYVEVKLHDWIYSRVTDPKAILTLSRNYFFITGGIARQLYRIARKMAGETTFTVPLDDVASRAGTEDPAQFKKAVRRLVAQVTDEAQGEFPDYEISLSARRGTELITFTKRKSRAPKPIPAVPAGRTFDIDDDSYDQAKQLCRDYDLDFHYWYSHWQEKQWQKHMDFIIQHGRPPLKHPGKAFIGYLQRVGANQK
jgi:hypothetical protein